MASQRPPAVRASWPGLVVEPLLGGGGVLGESGGLLSGVFCKMPDAFEAYVK